MYKSFNIHNFRCFKEIEITNLKRINIITGPNSVGKTALIEAIWMQQGPSNQGLGFLVNVHRGYRNINFQRPLEEIFHNFDVTTPIKIIGTYHSKSNGEEIREYTLRTKEGSFMEQTPIPLENGQESANEIEDEYLRKFTIGTSEDLTSYIPEIQYQVLKNGDPLHSIETPLKVNIREKGLVFKQRKTIQLPNSIYIPTSTGATGKDILQRYSKLIRKKKKNLIIDNLKIIDPRITDIELIASPNDIGSPTIYADIDLPSENLVPLTLLGDGVSRLFSIIVNISSAQNGIVVIDEVERGFYYGVMVDVWKAIYETAKQANVQLFITSHSKECVLAAFEAFKEQDKDNLSVIKLSKKKDRIKASNLNKDALKAAKELDLEVR